MATIKFLLQSKKPEAPVYCRLSMGRSNSVKLKTGFTIDPSLWDTTLGRAKGRDARAKALNHQLAKLDEVVFDSYNEAQTKGKVIDREWFEGVIEKAFDRKTIDKTEQVDGLVEYGRYFLTNLDFKVTDRGKRGVSLATSKKYTTIVNKLESFDKHSKKQFKLNEVDLTYRKALIGFFRDVENLSENTVGRYLKTVKTIVLDARKEGLETNPQIEAFKGYTVEIPKVTLSFDELERVKQASMPNETHERAKDWLILGCYMGQRVSDLLRVNTAMMERIEGYDFIVLTQQKTGKTVQIPIHSEVRAILDKREGEFPDSFANTIQSAAALFNRYIKEVCRLAGLNEKTEGNLYNEDSKRYDNGHFEKWKLVSSHICRRSFATNFYSDRKYPTPLLMNITAHSTEKQFLEYIGKKPIDYSLKLAELWSSDR